VHVSAAVTGNRAGVSTIAEGALAEEPENARSELAIDPSLSLDVEPSKAQASSEQLGVKRAVGALLTGTDSLGPTNSRWLLALLEEVMTPLVSALARKPATVAGVADGCPCRYRAAAPAPWGAAIDVPLIVAVSVVLVW